MPEGVEEGILRGLYRFAERARRAVAGAATILFSAAPRMARPREAQQLLAERLRRGRRAVVARRRTRRCARTPWRPSAGTGCTPAEPPRTPYVTDALARRRGPVRRRHRLHEGRARPGRPLGARRRSPPLGTDGYGRSDTRAALRRHFEVDAAHVVVAVLTGLAEAGDGKAEEVADAIARYDIDPDAPDPRTA